MVASPQKYEQINEKDSQKKGKAHLDARTRSGTSSIHRECQEEKQNERNILNNVEGAK